MGISKDIYKSIFSRREGPKKAEPSVEKNAPGGPPEKPGKAEKVFSLLRDRERYISLAEAKRRAGKSPYSFRRENRLKTQEQARESMERATKRIAELMGKKGKFLTRRDLERGLKKWEREQKRDRTFGRRTHAERKQDQRDYGFASGLYKPRQK